MEIEGTYTFSAPRDVVWSMMRDPDVLVKAIPSCEKLEQTNENSYNGILNILIGPMQGRFEGTIDLSEINEPERCLLTLKGNGMPGVVNGTGIIELVDEGDFCTVRYTGRAQVDGRLADVGQRLLETSARAIARQSLEGLAQQINAKMRPEGTKTAVNSPAQTNNTKNILTEIISTGRQEKEKTVGTTAVSLLLLAMLLFIVRLFSKARRRRLANEIADILEARARRHNNDQ